MHPAADTVPTSVAASTPTPLMAIAISRDHRSVLVGDAKGRVYAWSVPGGSGFPDNSNVGNEVVGNTWSVDLTCGTAGSGLSGAAVISCAAPACGTRFSRTEKRYNCKNCGRVFCAR